MEAWGPVEHESSTVLGSLEYGRASYLGAYGVRNCACGAGVERRERDCLCLLECRAAMFVDIAEKLEHVSWAHVMVPFATLLLQ